MRLLLTFVLFLVSFSAAPAQQGFLQLFDTDSNRSGVRSAISYDDPGSRIALVLDGKDWDFDTTEEFKANGASGFSVSDGNGNNVAGSPSGLEFFSGTGSYLYQGYPSYSVGAYDCGSVGGVAGRDLLCSDGGILSVKHGTASPVPLESVGSFGTAAGQKDISLQFQTPGSTVTVASIDTNSAGGADIPGQGALGITVEIVAGESGVAIDQVGFYNLKGLATTLYGSDTPIIEGTSSDNIDHDGVGLEDCVFAVASGVINVNCNGYDSYQGTLRWQFSSAGPN